MTGLQLASFWEGNRGQLFATYVLSSVAAVVPVPVPMDFGIDLLCTLTRREGRSLLAGQAFAVQVKAASEKEIPYGGLNDRGDWKAYEVQWLYGQRQPLLVCIVDVKDWRVSLYSTQFMWWVRYQRGIPGKVILVPDLDLDDFTKEEGRSMEQRYRSEELPATKDGQRAGDGFVWRVPLGKPIVEVSVKEQEAADYRDMLRECSNRWVALDYRNIQHMQGRVPYVEEWTAWTTNEPPEPPAKLWHFMNATPDQNIPEILSTMAPAATSLMHNLATQKQQDKLEAVKPLARLIRDYGLLDGTAEKYLQEE